MRVELSVGIPDGCWISDGCHPRCLIRVDPNALEPGDTTSRGRLKALPADVKSRKDYRATQEEPMDKSRNAVTGEPWATVADTKAGDTLIADDGFPCITDKAELTVYEDEAGLYVMCKGPDEGEFDAVEHHYLDGQIEGEFYIGLTRKKVS